MQQQQRQNLVQQPTSAFKTTVEVSADVIEDENLLMKKAEEKVRAFPVA